MGFLRYQKELLQLHDLERKYHQVLIRPIANAEPRAKKPLASPPSDANAREETKRPPKTNNKFFT